jgi:hypothetical protein
MVLLKVAAGSCSAGVGECSRTAKLQEHARGSSRSLGMHGVLRLHTTGTSLHTMAVQSRCPSGP